MKVNIVFPFSEGAAGGGNQFLHALRDYFIRSGNYCKELKEADAILFNSHHSIGNVVKYKLLFPRKPFIHRIDGPMSLYNRSGDIRDRITNSANRLLADATIFQSNWSMNENRRLGLQPSAFETVIVNGCDTSKFNALGRKLYPSAPKIRLVATSWSRNWNKGFATYQWIDNHLDFGRFEMVFIGNSPVQFKNIVTLPPLAADQLSVELKQRDIFITASKKDPCSNAVIEALSCGLPILASRDGGHPEIIGDCGLFYDNPEEIPKLLETMIRDYGNLRARIKPIPFELVGLKYRSFINEVVNAVAINKYQAKKPSLLSCLKIVCLPHLWRVKSRWAAVEQG